MQTMYANTKFDYLDTFINAMTKIITTWENKMKSTWTRNDTE